MAHFLFRLNSPRRTFPFDATAEEREAMGRHVGFWKGHADAGVALVVGPVMDPAGPWGLAVANVEDAAAARTLADADPIIHAGLGFSYDILPIAQIITGKA